jgi:uncharacterized membrane protein
MLDSLINSNLSRELITVILSMLPVAELRLSIPIAITVFNLPWYEAFGLGILGNLIPVPFLLLFFKGVSKLVQKIPIGKRFIDWLLKRTARHSGSIQKYEFAGLAVFVAIPLPLTGAWTASLLAYILGLRFWPSFLSICLGVIGAGIIVTILTLLGWVGAGIAIVALILLAAAGAWKL